MAKYRSTVDFSAIYASANEGFGTSVDNFLHVKDEGGAPGTFNPPSIGTQGVSTGASTPSTDITLSGGTTLKAAVDGNAAVSATVVVTGLNTGALIAGAFETAINTALSAAGYDARVWCEFIGGVYKIHSQKTGTASAVVITAGASNDVTAALKIGVANGGTEAVGTAGGDFLFQTKCDLKVTQPLKESEHKSGRQSLNMIKQKIMVEGSIECYLNVGSGGSASVDTALDTVLQSVLGNKVSAGGVISYDMASAGTKYFSLVQGSSIFGRYINGAYAKSLSIALAGNAPPKVSMPIKGRKGLYSSLTQVKTQVTASTNVTVQSGESPRFNAGSFVMVVDQDGRTVLAGYDGTLKVNSRTDGSDELVLSASVSVAANGYIVPYLPHVFDATGTDNPLTDLNGSVSFDGGSTTITEIKSVTLTVDPQVEDQDSYYGADSNRGRTTPNRAKLSVDFEINMSAQQFKHIIEATEQTTANIQVTVGVGGGRGVQFNFPKVYWDVPDTTIPDSGSLVVKFKGTPVQTAPGKLDAFTYKYV